MIIKANYQYKNNELKDKVILMTGATQGLGRASSIALAGAGVTVILLGRDLAALEQTYDLITALNLPEPILYPLDLLGATPKNYQEMVQVIKKQLGRLDGIVHNAATAGSMMTLQQYDIKTWYAVMQVNLHAPFLLTQACLPLLLEVQDGRILFISDKVGRKPKAYWGAYGISKSALEALMQTLADELESTNIKVNSLDSGAMKTTLRSHTYPAQNLDKLPKPEKVAPAVVYLFSKGSSKIKGQQLTIKY